MKKWLKGAGILKMNTSKKGGRVREITGLDNLEVRLQEALRPVSLPPLFQQELKSRLLITPETTLRRGGNDTYPYIFLFTAGLLSGVLLLILGVRSIIGLLGSLGLLQQVKSNFPQDSPSPVQPTS
jgi:hypothetical protein